MLPSAQTLCDILIKASETLPLDLKNVPLELISAVYPEKYAHLVKPIETDDSREQTVFNELPYDTDFVAMFSGGIGSTAALWKLVTSGRDFTLMYIEKMFYPEVEAARTVYVKDMVLEGKLSNGHPFQREGNVSLLDSCEAPRNAHLLTRKARVAVIVARVYEHMKLWNVQNQGQSGSQAVAFVWGSVFDCTDVFRAMHNWKVKHVILFPNRETALLCVSHGEVVTDNLRDKHRVPALCYAPGPMLIYQCLNRTCSCWGPKFMVIIRHDYVSKFNF